MKKRLLEFAESIGIKKAGFGKHTFAALFPYYVKGSTGNISVYARSEDYHTVAENKLRIIEEEMHRLGAVHTEVHADKGKYNDRNAAYEAGLGFYGMNGMLICEEYGSYFFIGQIIHDLKIEPDEPAKRDCLRCGECRRCCPGNAIGERGVNIERCVSQISQKKGELSREEEKLIIKSGLCWGCDVCQTVCPHNRGLETTAMPEFTVNRIESLSLHDIEPLSGRAFKRKYGGYAFSWRGKGVLERNLKVLSRAWEETDE